MFKITIPAIDLFNEETSQFITSKAYELQLEHSLVSLSKWESFWKKPFLAKDNKTTAESIDYVRCMTITQNIDPDAYKLISKELLDKIAEYIDDPMTATTFSQDLQKTFSKEIITSELIYYWMVAFNIPFECQRWHLNRLLVLIRICSIKNQPTKKLKPRDIASRNKALNDARKAKYNTSG